MTSGRSKIRKASGNRYIRKLVLVTLGSLLLTVALANGQQPKVTNRVLILITGAMGVPGHHLSEEGMRASLEQTIDFQFEYFIEYMDRFRFKDTSYQKDLLDLYRTKYSSKKIDLIIAQDYYSLDFAAIHREEIFPHTPLVFCNVLETHLTRLNLDQKFAAMLASARSGNLHLKEIRNRKGSNLDY